jgi:hypothetical protein
VTAKAKIGVLCLAVVLAFALSTGIAGAKKRHKKDAKVVSSQVTLESVGPDGANGIVSSPRSDCLVDRTVTLYMVGSEGSLRTADPVAATRTRRDGSWTAALFAGHALYPGDYYAVVDAKRSSGIACATATSGDRQF